MYGVVVVVVGVGDVFVVCVGVDVGDVVGVGVWDGGWGVVEFVVF